MKDIQTNTNKFLMVKSDGDDTLENMRIASLEKDSEILDDDEAIQVMRINERGEAVEIIPGVDDDDDDRDESLIMLPEKIIGNGITKRELKDTEGSTNG